MAYSVQQRTQEIGIRVALGAGSHTVRNMIIRQGMSIALLGVAIGVASAYGLTRVIASFLFGVTARDPVVFVSVPLVLSGVALLGVWLPARRAARVDPVVALRIAHRSRLRFRPLDLSDPEFCYGLRQVFPGAPYLVGLRRRFAGSLSE